MGTTFWTREIGGVEVLELQGGEEEQNTRVSPCLVAQKQWDTGCLTNRPLPGTFFFTVLNPNQAEGPSENCLSEAGFSV